jgi:hypothetical protein
METMNVVQIRKGEHRFVFRWEAADDLKLMSKAITDLVLDKRVNFNQADGERVGRLIGQKIGNA